MLLHGSTFNAKMSSSLTIFVTVPAWFGDDIDLAHTRQNTSIVNKPSLPVHAVVGLRRPSTSPQ